MNLSILPDSFAVCRLSPRADVPRWAWENRAFLSLTYTADELTVICLDSVVPSTVQCERAWRVIKAQGPLVFSLTGILAGLTAPLAEAGIAIFAISTFDTDYLLVKEASLFQAKAVLEQHGHVFI